MKRQQLTQRSRGPGPSQASDRPGSRAERLQWPRAALQQRRGAACCGGRTPSWGARVGKSPGWGRRRKKKGHTRGGTARPPPPPDRASHTPWGSHPTGTEGRTQTNGLPTGPHQEDRSRMRSNRKKRKRVTRASSGHVHGHWRSPFSKSAFSGSLDRLPTTGVGGGRGLPSLLEEEGLTVKW